MTAYRDGASPGALRSLEVGGAPRWLAPALWVVLLLLFLRPWLGQRTVEISCGRASDWSCEVTERRLGWTTSRRTVRVGSFADVRLRIADDGGLEAFTDRGMLALFTLDEARRAREALESLARASADATRVHVRVRRPIDPLEPFAALLVLPAFVLLGRRVRVRYTDEGVRVAERFVRFVEIDEIAVTDEPRDPQLVLPRWSLVMRLHDGARVPIASGRLLRGPLARAASALTTICAGAAGEPRA